jgi:hypothetical protein
LPEIRKKYEAIIRKRETACYLLQIKKGPGRKLSGPFSLIFEWFIE